MSKLSDEYKNLYEAKKDQWKEDDKKIEVEEAVEKERKKDNKRILQQIRKRNRYANLYVDPYSVRNEEVNKNIIELNKELGKNILDKKKLNRRIDDFIDKIDGYNGYNGSGDDFKKSNSLGMYSSSKNNKKNIRQSVITGINTTKPNQKSNQKNVPNIDDHENNKDLIKYKKLMEKADFNLLNQNENYQNLGQNQNIYKIDKTDKNFNPNNTGFAKTNYENFKDFKNIHITSGKDKDGNTIKNKGKGKGNNQNNNTNIPNLVLNSHRDVAEMSYNDIERDRLHVNKIRESNFLKEPTENIIEKIEMSKTTHSKFNLSKNTKTPSDVLLSNNQVPNLAVKSTNKTMNIASSLLKEEQREMEKIYNINSKRKNNILK